MGGPAGPVFMNASATCLEFWPTSAPIRVPQDTNTTKFGQIYIQTDEPDNVTSAFIDRHGKQFPISASAHPPNDALQLQQIWVLLVVEAHLDAASGIVTSYKPILYVPYKTIMATMEDTMFVSRLYNSDPRPAGVNETAWARWSFGSIITVTNATQKYGTLLHGTFDNLFRSVRDTKGVCQPALCSNRTSAQDPACAYYVQFFGNRTQAMTLNWDPNMHTPTDTELVPMFPAHNRQYMSEFMELYQLLRPYSFLPREYTFIGHGNPMGVPQNFTGVLTKASKLLYC